MTKDEIIELIKQRLDALREQRNSAKLPDMIAAYSIATGEIAWIFAKIMEKENQ